MNIKSSKFYFNDYGLWEPFLRQFLDKRKWSKHYKKIYVNLKIVNVGIKPSFLWDVGPIPSVLTLQTLIYYLKRESLLDEKICIYTLQDELFIVNREEINKVLSDEEYFQFMDVSLGISLPEKVDSNKDLFRELKKQINMGIMENDGGAYILYFPELYHIRIYGIMLGYPAVYSCDANNESFMNFISLINVKILIDCNDKANEIYSFTHLPLDNLSEHVNKWFQNLKLKFNNFGIKICKEHVTIPRIVL